MSLYFWHLILDKLDAVAKRKKVNDMLPAVWYYAYPEFRCIHRWLIVYPVQQLVKNMYLAPGSGSKCFAVTRMSRPCLVSHSPCTGIPYRQ